MKVPQDWAEHAHTTKLLDELDHHLGGAMSLLLTAAAKSEDPAVTAAYARWLSIQATILIVKGDREDGG